MKKVLLTTTALVMTAGVASAEITFSGSGEAGVYRLAPDAAVAAVRGYNADYAAVSDSTTDAAGGVGYDTTTFLLTTTKATAADQTATNKYGAAPTAAEIATQQAVVDALVGDLAEAQRAIDAVATQVAIANERSDLAKVQADLAAERAVLAEMTGTAATAKGATPKLKAYSGYDFDISASGASDNGMTFAMAFDMGAGSIADQDDDRAMDAQAGTIATSAMTIGYAGYTIRVGDDKLDDLYDDTQNGDIGIAGSLGDLTFSLVTDMDDDVKAVAASTYFRDQNGDANSQAADGTLLLADGTTAHRAASYVETAAVAAVYNPTSYAIGYTMGNVAFSMAGTEHDDRGHSAAKMSLNYTVSDALSVKLESDNVGTYKDIAKVSVTSKISDALSITASVKDDKDHALNTNTGGKQSQDVSISYSAGALSSTLATDEGSNWWVNAKYDLGGGATAFTTFDHTEFLVAGVNFKF